MEEDAVGEVFARVSSAFSRLCASTSSGFIFRIALKSSAAFWLSPAIIWAWARRRYPSGILGIGRDRFGIIRDRFLEFLQVAVGKRAPFPRAPSSGTFWTTTV